MPETGNPFASVLSRPDGEALNELFRKHGKRPIARE